MTSKNQVKIYELVNLDTFDAKIQHVFPPQVPSSDELETSLPNFILQPMQESQFIGPVATWEDAIYVHDADAAIYWDDPQGIYKGCLNDEMIGCCASFRKGSNIAWIGYYMVRPDYRKKRYGVTMFNKLLEYDQARGIEFHTLNCAEPLESMYESIGFKTYSYDTIYRGIYNPPTTTTVNLTTLPINQVWFDKINNYDKRIHHGWGRPESLSRWIAKKGTRLLIAASTNDEIIGFVTISDFRYPTADGVVRHQRLAPLYADNPECASKLIETALNICDSHSIFVDADGNNLEAMNIIEKFGIFSAQLRLARMSRPDLPNYYETQCIYSHTHYGSGP